jgi:hypothetical protein
MTSQPSAASASAFRPKRVAASPSLEAGRLSSLLLESNCPIFLDTNVVIWSFGLNESASLAWQKWLVFLRDRLAFPAWVVHEYNQRSGKPEVATPYQTLPRRLETVFQDVVDSAARALEDEAAVRLKFAGKADLERQLTAALDLVKSIAIAVAKSDRGHRLVLAKFYEDLLAERICNTNLHAEAVAAEAEFDARAGLRLSPGGEDAGKQQNRCGDLIIWREILGHCAERKCGNALFVSNDVKRDWCYTPAILILANGKEIPWSDSAAQGLRLPNPDLVAEFHASTGGDGLFFATVDQIVETLASTALNTTEAVKFKELAYAIRASRTPTDEVVDWFHQHPSAYREALAGVAAWERSPDEVEMELFEKWCREQMNDSGIALDRVSWMNVFVALFL